MKLLTSLHLQLFFVKSPDNVCLLHGRHGHVKHIHVIHVCYTIVILEGKTEIGIRALFQIYDPSSFLFKFADGTAKRIENFSSSATARYECPFFVPAKNGTVFPLFILTFKTDYQNRLWRYFISNIVKDS